MYGSNPTILFISQHLTSSLFSWKPFKDVNVVFTLGLIEEILLNFRGRGFFILSDFFILKKKGSPKRVLIKICFRYKMMAIFFTVACVNNLLKSFTDPELQDLHSTLKLFSQLTEEARWWIPMDGGTAFYHHFRWMKESISTWIRCRSWKKTEIASHCFLSVISVTIIRTYMNYLK